MLRSCRRPHSYLIRLSLSLSLFALSLCCCNPRASFTGTCRSACSNIGGAQMWAQEVAQAGAQPGKRGAHISSSGALGGTRRHKRSDTQQGKQWPTEQQGQKQRRKREHKRGGKPVGGQAWDKWGHKQARAPALFFLRGESAPVSKVSRTTISLLLLGYHLLEPCQDNYNNAARDPSAIG
jgi:hypothetical protein